MPKIAEGIRESSSVDEDKKKEEDASIVCGSDSAG